MPKKVKMVVYLSKEVHERIMDAVLERVNAERRFRGAISDVVEDFMRDHFGLPKENK